MKEILRLCVVAVALTLGAVVGCFAMLAALLGVNSGEPSLVIVGHVIAVALLVNCKGVVALFLGQSSDFMLKMADIIFPGLLSPNDEITS